MNGMNSFCNGSEDWHRIEQAKRYNRPVNSFVAKELSQLISMDHQDLSIYCDQLQQIIAATPGIDISPLSR